MDLLRRSQPYKDKLVLKEVLGSGAVSTVRRAVDRKNNKITFAAKIEQKQNLLRNHGACESFGKEIDALTSLKHANIVSWHGIQENDRDLALITEFAPFGDVASMGPLESLECSLVATQMMEGLAYMHSQGFVHGDIKGQNMLVVTRNPISIRLTDFGTSVRIDEAESCGITCCKDTMSELPAGVNGRRGTMQYMAPEVLLTDFCCFASDIWSAAVVCKALPTGVNPFTGITEQEDMERAVNQLLETAAPVCNLPVLSSLLSSGAGENKTVCVKSESELDKAVFRREPAERPCARTILSHAEWLSFGAERQEPQPDEAAIKKMKVALLKKLRTGDELSAEEEAFCTQHDL
jgi:serine/threonine protein kinase